MSVIDKNRTKPKSVIGLQSGAVRRNRRKGGASSGSGRRSRLVWSAASFFGAVLISFCFVAGYIGITGSDLLGVTEISVSGACLLEKDMVIRQARIKPGDNILAVNLQVTRRHLLQHHWIDSARVSRRLPGTILVEIREHSPLAVIELGQRYFVDENRKLFKRLEEADPVGVPLITGVDYSDLDATGRPGSDILKAALDTVETGARLRKMVPGMAIRQVSVDRDTGITLYAFNHIDRVRLGFDADNDRYTQKFRRLKELLFHLDHGAGNMSIATVDLECPDRVVVKPQTSLSVSGNSYKGG